MFTSSQITVARIELIVHTYFGVFFLVGSFHYQYGRWPPSRLQNNYDQCSASTIFCLSDSIYLTPNVFLSFNNISNLMVMTSERHRHTQDIGTELRTHTHTQATEQTGISSEGNIFYCCCCNIKISALNVEIYRF